MTLAIFGKKIGIARAKAVISNLRSRKAEAQQKVEDLEDLETIIQGLWTSLDETLGEIDQVGQLVQASVRDARAKAKQRKAQLDKIFADE